MTKDDTAEHTAFIVTLSVASVPIPASRDGRYPADTHLAGIGLVIAQCRDDRWATDVHILTIAAGQPEAMLLEQMTSLLPAHGILTGWRIAEAVLPPLLSAARVVDPDIAQRFLQVMKALTIEPTVDLAIYEEADQGTPFIPRHDPTPGRPPLAAEITESAWATGRPQALELLLRAQVETLWRMWLDRFEQGVPREAA